MYAHQQVSKANAMDNYPSVQLIVLNWNGRAYLNACLAALSRLTYTNYNILLVDNDSTDDSVDFVRRRFPHVPILQNEKNLGYAGGNNRALRALDNDYAVLVNPDIVVEANWLSELITAMHADPSIAIAGCKLHYPGGKMIQHAGGSISHPQAMPVHRGIHETDTGQFDAVLDVDYVTGATIAIGRTALQNIGPLDEGYFMYFEEADWCARARAAGYRVVYIPRAAAVHDESAIAIKGSPSYLERFHAGRWRYLLKHFSPGEILSQTFPAEKSWLSERHSGERRALNHVYRSIYAGLDEILATRASSGGGDLDARPKELIGAELLDLRRITLKQIIEPEQANRLAQKMRLREIPLQSQIPIAGPYIAQLRTLWASVAIQEQVQSFTTQQSEINQILANELGDLEKRIQVVQLALLDHDQRQVEIVRQQLKVRASLSLAYRLLDSIASRLEHIEKSSGDR